MQRQGTLEKIEFSLGLTQLPDSDKSPFKFGKEEESLTQHFLLKILKLLAAIPWGRQEKGSAEVKSRELNPVGVPP